METSAEPLFVSSSFICGRTAGNTWGFTASTVTSEFFTVSSALVHMFTPGFSLKALHLAESTSKTQISPPFKNCDETAPFIIADAIFPQPINPSLQLIFKPPRKGRKYNEDILPHQLQFRSCRKDKPLLWERREPLLPFSCPNAKFY